MACPGPLTNGNLENALKNEVNAKQRDCGGRGCSNRVKDIDDWTLSHAPQRCTTGLWAT